MPRSSPRRWVRAATVALVVSALARQLTGHVVDAITGSYHGQAWEPRVKAILDVSRVAAARGPYLAVERGGRFEPVDRKVNDLGMAAFAYASARVTGRPINRRTLLTANLLIALAALAVTFWMTPAPLRIGLLPLLVVPIVVPEYRSPDPLATHGALALLGTMTAASLVRAGPLWTAVPAGLALFAVLKIRSAYALYAVAAAGLLAATCSWRTRSWPAIARFALMLLTMAALEVPWQAALHARAQDPRVVEQDTIGTHPVYIALLEGVGWSPNPWGLRPWDPWVASYMATRLDLPPVDVGTRESERRARFFYSDLWASDPGGLLAVYLRRVPSVAAERFALGDVGLLAFVPLAVLALGKTRDAAYGVVFAMAAMTAALLFQSVVLDPRLLYAYPLELVSALSLGLSLAAVLVASRWASRERPSS